MPRLPSCLHLLCAFSGISTRQQQRPCVEWIKWGRPVQDIARWLYYELYQNSFMGYTVGKERPGLVVAFEQGYRTRRPWPQDGNVLNALVAKELMDSMRSRKTAENKEKLALARQTLELLMADDPGST